MYKSDKDSIHPCPNMPYYQEPVYYEPIYEEPLYRDPIYYEPAPMYPEKPLYMNCPLMDPKIRKCIEVCIKMNCGK